jgi:hypothetical protein
MTTRLRTLVLTAVRRDGTTDPISTRTIPAGKRVNLYSEARTELDRCIERDESNARRMVRNETEPTVSVVADLRAGRELLDRDEAHR